MVSGAGRGNGGVLDGLRVYLYTHKNNSHAAAPHSHTSKKIRYLIMFNSLHSPKPRTNLSQQLHCSASDKTGWQLRRLRLRPRGGETNNFQKQHVYRRNVHHSAEDVTKVLTNGSQESSSLLMSGIEQSRETRSWYRHVARDVASRTSTWLLAHTTVTW